LEGASYLDNVYLRASYSCPPATKSFTRTPVGSAREFFPDVPADVNLPASSKRLRKCPCLLDPRTVNSGEGRIPHTTTPPPPPPPPVGNGVRKKMLRGARPAFSSLSSLRADAHDTSSP